MPPRNAAVTEIIDGTSWPSPAVNIRIQIIWHPIPAAPERKKIRQRKAERGRREFMWE
jgi:hypothetical protein